MLEKLYSKAVLEVGDYSTWAMLCWGCILEKLQRVADDLELSALKTKKVDWTLAIWLADFTKNQWKLKSYSW